MQKINYKQAAILYLLHWQIGESPSNSPERVLEVPIENRLTRDGYPNPNSIVYDNEAIPLIDFTKFGAPEDFSCEQFYGLAGDQVDEENMPDTSMVLNNPYWDNVMYLLNQYK